MFPRGTSSPRSGAASKYFESILTTLATLECSKREQLPQQLNPRTTPHEIRWQHHGARVFVFPPYFCVFFGEVSYQQYKSASAFLNGRKGPRNFSLWPRWHRAGFRPTHHNKLAASLARGPRAPGSRSPAPLLLESLELPSRGSTGRGSDYNSPDSRTTLPLHPPLPRWPLAPRSPPGNKGAARSRLRATHASAPSARPSQAAVSKDPPSSLLEWWRGGTR